MPTKAGPTHNQRMWNELDLAVDEFMKIIPAGSETPVRYYELRGQITGVSSCILLWMTPIFASIDEVKREAVKRHKKRLANEHYETAGVEYSWRPGQATPGRAVPVPALPAIPPETVEKIYGAFDSGMFTVAELEPVIGLSAAAIQLILDNRK